jgi:hypothetical protein
MSNVHLSEKVCHQSSLDRILQVGVVENDDWRFSAQFQCDVPNSDGT